MTSPPRHGSPAPDDTLKRAASDEDDSGYGNGNRTPFSVLRVLSRDRDRDRLSMVCFRALHACGGWHAQWNG